eukprot:scaffold1240_cov101-Isochrysis_galbana.AAC.18
MPSACDPSPRFTSAIATVRSAPASASAGSASVCVDRWVCCASASRRCRRAAARRFASAAWSASNCSQSGCFRGTTPGAAPGGSKPSQASRSEGGVGLFPPEGRAPAGAWPFSFSASAGRAPLLASASQLASTSAAAAEDSAAE